MTLRLFTAALLLLIAPMAHAFDGFCGTYAQTDSTLADCPDCRLIIADNPKIQFYFVESNTGWTAELHWVDGDETVATGAGTWGANLGAYSHATFDIDLSSQGDRLDLILSHHDPSLNSLFQASYACLD